MAIISPPPFVQGGSHSAKQVRQLVSALSGQAVETFTNSVGAVGPAHGLARAGDLAVTQNGTPNMSVNMGIGRAFISGNSSLVQGAYVFTNDAVLNVVIAPADATNGRRDLVCAQVRETIEDASGFNDARAFVVTGTPAAVPVDPAIPAGCLVLARVTVAAAVTSITNANITTVALKHRSKLTEQTDRAAFELSNSVAQSIPNATTTAVSFDTNLIDTSGLKTAPTTVTIPTAGAGLWLIGYSLNFFQAATGIRQAWMRKNSSAGDRYGIDMDTGTASRPSALGGSALLRLAATDTLQLTAIQDSGAAQNIQGQNSANAVLRFWGTRMGD